VSLSVDLRLDTERDVEKRLNYILKFFTRYRLNSLGPGSKVEKKENDHGPMIIS